MRRPNIVVFLSILALLGSAPVLSAQIIGRVVATIPHPFVVDNTTLPAGTYYFQPISQANPQIGMTCLSADGQTVVAFLVDAAHADHKPQRTELIFGHSGNEEVLRKIFEADDQWGLQVAATELPQMRNEGE